MSQHTPRTMSAERECSAFLPKNGMYGPCHNGFPQILGACMGLGGTPVCCDENLCGRLYPETGKPPEHMLDLLAKAEPSPSEAGL